MNIDILYLKKIIQNLSTDDIRELNNNIIERHNYFEDLDNRMKWTAEVYNYRYTL